MALIFDIETVGDDFDSLDETTRDNLTRWISRQAAGKEETYNALLADLKEGLGFSPLTGKIVALGVFDTLSHRGVVYYQSPDVAQQDFQDGSFYFKPRTEEEMLQLFWKGSLMYKEFVSFNGRSFDIPFIAMRSAKYKIHQTVNLMGYRYYKPNNSGIQHIDLLDQMSYYGAVRRKGSLHLYCRMFNIHSPKGDGITGDDMGRMFAEKKYREIAEYNSWDLIATADLYKVWKEYLLI